MESLSPFQVRRVYDAMRESGADLMMPPPPVHQGCNSIDILGIPPNLSFIMFGALKHVQFPSTEAPKFVPNPRPYSLNPKCLLNCTPAAGQPQRAARRHRPAGPAPRRRQGPPPRTDRNGPGRFGFGREFAFSF